MERAPTTPRRTGRGRPRGRATTALRPVRRKALPAGASEPPPKRRRYVPGGPGGGGRFIEEDAPDNSPAPSTSTVSRTRGRTSNVAPPAFPRRERSARIRTAGTQDEEGDMQFGSAAAVAAAVVQSEGYKPREERGWEEFHPNLDIEATFMVYHAEDVDGTTKPAPPPPSSVQHTDIPVDGNDLTTPSKTGAVPTPIAPDTPAPPAKPSLNAPPFTTPRRRVGRPPRDPFAYYNSYLSHPGASPRTPKILPISNQTPKERLDLKLPSYRKTDRILLFESKKFGQARYVDKSMMNVGYQESDHFIRPERELLQATETNIDDDPDIGRSASVDSAPAQSTPSGVGRVEYDMDEQDDMWLESLNAQRKASGLLPITREIFEIAITKIEKEWHVLEKRIPKPNPKPPQTHRPRSSSAAAVNGETQSGEEQDSKCAICDDGDCENTNAIVFCDGCDLAVHQECYGVPFIPEGQWLCRKCQLIGRGIPTCIFCPNTDGAFKQTNSSKWAHLLCAMWIPEVSLGNHTFMEPVMEVEKVPKNRWKLTCYICSQRMGACIQCSNKNCYQAFHVTCARRGHLFLKMKNSQGALSVLEGNVLLKAYCDKHCPQDYARENSVALATRQAKRFYKRTMKGRMWVDSHASAAQLAATHRHAITEHPPDESQMTGAKVSAVLADKKKGQPGKPIWKLPSGAPVIPQAVYDIVESSLARFPIVGRKGFIADACRYWTLKREARRGAALLKRLQLQMETFSSMELTRRNFAAMGPSGQARLSRRIDFATSLVEDLKQLRTISLSIVEREATKLASAELVRDFVDSSYFPIYGLLIPVVDKAFAIDRDVFDEGLSKLRDKLDKRYYTTTLAFAHDLCEVIHVGINGHVQQPVSDESGSTEVAASSSKTSYVEARDRKRLGKRILKAIHPLLETALRAEADVSARPFDVLLKELEGMLDASLGTTVSDSNETANTGIAGGEEHDVAMIDADGSHVFVPGRPRRTRGSLAGSGSYGSKLVGTSSVPGAAGVAMDVDGEDVGAGALGSEALDKDAAAVSANGSAAGDSFGAGRPPKDISGMAGDVDSPPLLNGYESAAAQTQALGPLTPPQSNRSLGHATANVLTDGGVPWYLEGFGIRGTSAAREGWDGQKTAVRSLSEEELTDIDDDELKGLENDVDDETINASPVDGEPDDRKEIGAAGAAGGVTPKAVAAALKKKATRTSPVKVQRALRSSAKR